MVEVPVTSNSARMVGEAFLVGFASTAGMLVVIAIVAHRRQIGDYFKKVSRYAIQEAR